MPKWEMCYIDEKVRHKFRLFKELSYKHEVHLMTPDGPKKIMESPPFEEDVDRKNQLVILIAKLGLEGWEPVPAPVSRGSTFFLGGGGSFNTKWFFKRPI